MNTLVNCEVALYNLLGDLKKFTSKNDLLQAIQTKIKSDKQSVAQLFLEHGTCHPFMEPILHALYDDLLASTYGLEILMNLLLVQENVRPAMMIQSIDYDEYTADSKKTKALLQAIKIRFPDLIHTSEYEGFQGIIISKKDFTGQSLYTNDMGEILGYPCYKDFKTINRNNAYSIQLLVEHDDKIYNLISNFCQTLEHEQEFEELAQKATTVFQKYGMDAKAFVITNKKISLFDLLEKIKMNEEISENEYFAIKNILWNMLFSEPFLDQFVTPELYKDPMYRGFLLSLLVQSQYYFPYEIEVKPDIFEEDIKPLIKEWEHAMTKFFSLQIE